MAVMKAVNGLIAKKKKKLVVEKLKLIIRDNHSFWRLDYDDSEVGYQFYGKCQYCSSIQPSLINMNELITTPVLD